MNGLKIYAKRDGTWIEFKSAAGNSSVFRLENWAEQSCVIGSAMREWITERRLEAYAAKPCPRCGVLREEPEPMDGCRDPDCPVMEWDGVLS